jgi:hypothetical protein
MPGWRRLRIMIDWFFALMFQPDIVKISLDSEPVQRSRDMAEAGAVAEPLEQAAARNGADTDSCELTGVNQ